MLYTLFNLNESKRKGIEMEYILVVDNEFPMYFKEYKELIEYIGYFKLGSFNSIKIKRIKINLDSIV